MVTILGGISMYSSKQQAINHYLNIMTDDLDHTFMLKETVVIKLPPAVEADWDTNDTKEFDRLLHKILFKERTLH